MPARSALWALLLAAFLGSCSGGFTAFAVWLGFAPEQLSEQDAMFQALEHPDAERRATALRELKKRTDRMLDTLQESESADPDQMCRDTAAAFRKSIARRATLPD